MSSCNDGPTDGIVHVLGLDHYLGFSTSALYQRALEAGIDYPDKGKNSGTRLMPIIREEETDNLFVKEKNDE